MRARYIDTLHMVSDKKKRKTNLRFCREVTQLNPFRAQNHVTITGTSRAFDSRRNTSAPEDGLGKTARAPVKCLLQLRRAEE